ncbi:MAG: hypothetical protein GWM92_12680 [Gemmatimonadetes bacterium]|nr:hypothetical protein [Gemmatimonadota bacterium]NIR79555.1 hypothetical protein [Gemmatimonadota bacterium]NIT88234.1 hypothetical protein [Gemmatimonadota bacterium]NIU32042.1 hypothetical protein [Gemmatimonadota bacterium]NIU36651.1 hypothetical protein [Gemmatimonadota bacterium]
MARSLLVPAALLAAACADSGSADGSREAAASPLADERIAALERLVGNSPDGVIAFLSTEAGGLVLMDPTSGRTEYVTKGFTPEWSRNGRALSYMWEGRIYLVETDAWSARRLPVAPFPFDPPFQVRPVLSPDGEQIAYGRYGGIVLSDLTGAEASYLTPPSAGDDLMPAWSPDGRRIALVRRGDIHVMDADGSGMANLTGDGAGNRDPEWSPAGDRIAYSSGRGGDRKIWTILADASVRRVVTAGADTEAQRHFHPSWSPDGSRIVFEGWGAEGRPSAELYVVEVEGGEVRRLTESPGFDGRPSWGSVRGADRGQSEEGIIGSGRPRRPGA